jgi:aminopeptidase
VFSLAHRAKLDISTKGARMTLIDPRFERWADVQVNYCVSVQPGDRVAISGGVEAAPLLRALVRSVLRAGGHPVVQPVLDGVQSDLLTLGSDEQLAFISPLETFSRTEAECSIRVIAETNTRASSELDPRRQQFFQNARASLRQIDMQRAAEGKHRWSLTIFPTAAHAQDAGMSTDAYADFLFSACKLDRDDPIAAWGELRAEQQRLIDWLTPRSTIHVTGPDTDLTLETGGRTWINSDGKRNFPSGEIFTGPVETSANGTIRFSFPVATSGREIEDVRLRFIDGVVVEASAARNEEYLLSMLDSDEGARRLGEFAFGTNFDITRFTKSILLDEKIGGTIHMALGAGYPDTGSVNRSAIHWDLICDLRQQGRVTVDGVPFLEGGRFLV